jgi:CubicO group peptidase (beta-lactamase class C family)
MKLRRVPFILLTAILASTQLFAAVSAEKVARIDQTVKRYYDVGRFGGMVLVAEDGKIVYEKGFGFANAEWNIPNSAKAKYRIGSVTKQFTSMIVMQLVQENKIKLDGTLSDYLPYYRKDTGSKVTIHQLLTHTSGIPSYTDSREFRNTMRDPVKSPKDFVLKYCSGDLLWEPGSKWAYNNSGYFILGAILEQVTGKPYEVLVRQRIFDPLGMKDTGYDHSETVIPDRASGYERDPAGDLQNAQFLDMGAPYAAGSLYSTVEDLLKWDQALYTDKLLSPELKQKMFTPVKNNYAYGWVVEEPRPNGPQEFTIAHAGGINGFSSQFVRQPKSKYTIVVLGNYPSPTGPVMHAIDLVLHDAPVPPIKRSAVDEIRPLLFRQGVAAAIAKLDSLKSDPANYDFSEGEVNALGYGLVAAGKTSDAIEIFKLNVKEHPTSANVYDSLGEAYASAGQRDLAIKTYEKALELDPKMPSAIDALKKLKASAEAGANPAAQ